MSDRIMAPDMTRPTGSSEAKIPEGELLSACIAARARPSTTRTPGPALTPSRILARAPRTLAFSDRPPPPPPERTPRPPPRPTLATYQWARPEPQTPRNASTRARCAARANPPRGRARPPWRNSPTPKSDKRTSSDPWCAREPRRARAARPPRPPRVPLRPDPPLPSHAPISPPREGPRELRPQNARGQTAPEHGGQPSPRAGVARSVGVDVARDVRAPRGGDGTRPLRRRHPRGRGD